MTHSPTPWRLSVTTMFGTTNADGSFGAVIGQTHYAHGEVSYAAARENAERIVACVNACDGIDSEDLSRMSLKGLQTRCLDLGRANVSLTASLGEARAERDALRAALVAMVALAQDGMCPHEDGPELQYARAALSGVAPDSVALLMTRDQAQALAQCLDFDLEDLSTVTITEDEDGYEDFKRVEQVRELLKEQGL